MSLEKDNLVEFHGFRFDLSEQTLWYSDKRISLAPRVLQTLKVLVESNGRLLPKEELMDEIWGDTFVEERNLTQNIFTLRKEFKKRKKDVEFIETVPRRGYRFVAKCTSVQIAEEEAIQINHKKSFHITAEGALTNEEIQNVLNEVPTNLDAENEKIPVSVDSAKPEKPRLTRSPYQVPIASGIVLALAIGAFFVWQNDFLKTGKSDARKGASLTQIKIDPLTESGNDYFPAVSPDRKLLAFVKNEDEKFSLILKDLASGSDTVVVRPQPAELRSPQFSSNGSHLFYGARDGKMETTVYRIPIFGGTARQILTNVNQNFSISPDGKQIAYFRNNAKSGGNQLLVCAIDGSKERIVSEKPGRTLFRVWSSVPGWSPNGEKLAVVVVETIADKNGVLKRPYLLEIDVNSGRENQINTPVWENVMSAKWKASGNALIVRAQEKPKDYFKLYRLSYPDGKATPITNDTGNYTDFALAPDDEFIITTEERNPYNLQLIDKDNPLKIRSLTSSTNSKNGYDGLQWMPDGKQLIFCITDGLTAREIWKISVLTNEKTQLTFDNDKTNKYPKVSPDGKYIYYTSNRSGQYQIWRMKPDGSDQKKITELDGGASFTELSSDGRWLIYATPAIKPNALWKQKVDGTERKLILNGAGGKSYISPDMKQVLASFYDSTEKENDPWKYILIPFENDGSVKDRRSITQTTDLSWDKNSKGIYYINLGRGHTNISYLSISDKSTTPITRYESQVMTNLSISPDGKLIAVARGKRSSNINKLSNF